MYIFTYVYIYMYIYIYMYDPFELYLTIALNYSKCVDKVMKCIYIQL